MHCDASQYKVYGCTAMNHIEYMSCTSFCVDTLILINNSRRKLKTKFIFNQCVEIAEEDDSQILLTLISIFSHNISEFEKYVPTL